MQLFFISNILQTNFSASYPAYQPSIQLNLLSSLSAFHPVYQLSIQLNLLSSLTFFPIYQPYIQFYQPYIQFSLPSNFISAFFPIYLSIIKIIVHHVNQFNHCLAPVVYHPYISTSSSVPDH